MDFDATNVLSEIAELDVTEEPTGGSEAPTGGKIMTSTEKPDKTDD